MASFVRGKKELLLYFGIGLNSDLIDKNDILKLGTGADPCEWISRFTFEKLSPDAILENFDNIYAQPMDKCECFLGWRGKKHGIDINMA